MDPDGSQLAATTVPSDDGLPSSSPDDPPEREAGVSGLRVGDAPPALAILRALGAAVLLALVALFLFPAENARGGSARGSAQRGQEVTPGRTGNLSPSPIPRDIAALELGPALAQVTGGDETVGNDAGGTEVSTAEGRIYPGYRRDAARAHLDRYREMTDRAIDRGLRYLSERQSDAGHFSAKYSVAVTALGGMAMIGNGITYGRGAYGYDVRQAVEYLTSPAILKHNGFITEGDSTDTPSKMHGHTYAILFLSQVVGTLPNPNEDEAVRQVVAKGVELIIDSQTARGGWGYMPGDESDEASLTVCALQALRAAKDAGFHVPPDTIRAAVRYLKESCKEDGSFRYSLTRGSRESTYELTAAAVSTLDAAGEYGMSEHARGVQFLRSTLFATIGRKGGVLDAASGYPYYGNLYAGQVYFQLGGELWETWSQEAWPELLRRQKPDGSWESRFGGEYATAVALMILEIPRGYLPIFER